MVKLLIMLSLNIVLLDDMGRNVCDVADSDGDKVLVASFATCGGVSGVESDSDAMSVAYNVVDMADGEASVLLLALLPS